MWKPEHRAAAECRGLRYPSDLTDAEWALVEPLIPPAKHGGRHREVNVREVLNAIFYVLSTGCQWQALTVIPLLSSLIGANKKPSNSDGRGETEAVRVISTTKFCRLYPLIEPPGCHFHRIWP